MQAGDKDPGYRLPDGDLENYDLDCLLVFYPDREEYRRALLGSLSYLATWLAWERDAEKRGRLAAAAWLDALNCTLECLEMACLDNLTAVMESVKILLVNQICCDQTLLDYHPTTIITTTIVPGQGPDPTVYGETSVADWDEWYEHICFQAHNYVDELVNIANSAATALTAGALTLGILSQFLNVLQFILLPIAFFWSDVTEWLANLLASPVAILDDTAADIEAARQSIVCTIMQNTDLGQAVQDAITNDDAWTYLFGLINYDGVKALIYEGGHDGNYLPTETRSTGCDCFQYDYYGIWNPGSQLDWSTYDMYSVDWVTGQFIPYGQNHSNPTAHRVVAEGVDMLGIFDDGWPSTQFEIVQVRFDYMFYTNGQSPHADYRVWYFTWNGTTNEQIWYAASTALNWDVWHTITLNEAQMPGFCIPVGEGYRNVVLIALSRARANDFTAIKLRNIEVWGRDCT